MPDSQVSYEEEDEEDLNSEADTLDRMLENYHFNFQPEIRLKWCKRVKDVAITAAYAKPWNGKWGWRFVLKPGDEEQRWGNFVRKVLLVPGASVAAMSTPKLKLGAFRLQFDFFYNLRDKRFGLDYRLTTKFSDGPRLSSKYRFYPTTGVTLRAKHFMSWVPPQVSGHIGTDADNDVQDVDLYGKFDLDITQLDFKFDLP